MPESMTVRLEGYPEAVLARGSVPFAATASTTAAEVVRHVAGLDARLERALTRDDGRVRQSTKVLVGGEARAVGASVGDAREVTVLAALPCDG
ncbi:hypothetical protein [Nocardiopsis baichengensis]|uniref:hypothetical protein n=1 Tax=Nocardiopsis baichengensis TaxID=280240 RepID=UPI0003488D04|nr:hypothetical protein [Nocardiopsis baichengensis]